ncbi:MAG: pantoate--beta-alanine ligase [Rhodobacteraceae bacterium]|nr:pantoate--beta-alanine ligase [Paracoccaceae bacterium]
MKIIRTRADLRAATAAWRQAGESIGVVPTMGALHEGHLSLVTAAKSTADRVIVTLFVNPRQFNNAADLAAYPRTETSDAEKLGPFAVDVLYIPDPDQMYPKGFATTVSVGGLDQGLCGAHRPGHFDGVATVVTKLFIQTDADAAFFGEKDFQQLQIVRTLARDLDLHIRVIGCPTVREADGFALSSRNVRLGSKARADAPGLYRALQAAAARINAGDPVADVIGAARAAILAAGYTEVEYLELRSEDGLEPLTAPRTPARLLVAAWIDGVRLIDNIRL